MNTDALSRRFSGLHSDNRVLRLCVVFLLVTNVALVFGFVFMTKSTYTANTADESALSSWGLYLSTLLGNVTPANADFTADTVGHLVAPSIYKRVMDGISQQVTKIKTDQLSLQFDPAEVKFSAGKSAVTVDGWLTTTDSHGTSSREEFTYEIYFDVVNYQPRIVGLNSYAGKPDVGK